METKELMIGDKVIVKVPSQIPVPMYCTLGLLMIIQGLCKSSLSHSRQKYLRRMGGGRREIEIEYQLNGLTNSFDENDLFATKEELLKSL